MVLSFVYSFSSLGEKSLPSTQSAYSVFSELLVRCRVTSVINTSNKFACVIAPINNTVVAPVTITQILFLLQRADKSKSPFSVLFDY
jgi:hypothetical protein